MKREKSAYGRRAEDPLCWFGVNVTARVEHHARKLMLAVRG
jgi:hypothetical protein